VTTGTVTFSIDGIKQPPVPIRVVNGHGQASLTTAALAAGGHKVVATYGGGGTSGASTSGPLNQTVSRAAPAATTSVAVAPPPSASGKPVTFAMTVNGGVAGIPTGIVTFREGSAVRAVVPLDRSGRAAFTTATQTPGTHTITEDYSGDAGFAPSRTSAVEVVGRGVAPVADLAITLAVAPEPAPAGRDLTYTITVLDSGPAAASGVVVLETLPPGFRELSLTYDRRTSVGAVLAGNVVHADLGTVPAGERDTIVIVARPSAAGTFADTARAQANEADPTPADNAAAVTGIVLGTPAAGDGPRVTGLRRYGFHAQPTILVLSFDGPLDPSLAEDVANYTLAGPVGGPGRGGHPIAIGAAIYDASAHTVTPLPVRGLNVHHRSTLTINGTGPRGIAGPSGSLLDGAGAGRPGSEYAIDFGREILAGPAHAYRLPGRTPAAAVVASPRASGPLLVRGRPASY